MDSQPAHGATWVSFFVVVMRMLFSGWRTACPQRRQQVPSRQAAACVGPRTGPRVLRPWHTAPTPGGPDVGCSPRPRALGRPSGASAQAVPLIQSVIGLNVLGASPRFLGCVTVGRALRTGNHASADNRPFLIPQEPMCTPTSPVPLAHKVCVCLGSQRTGGTGMRR